jgi:hypothetical protein
MNSESVDVTAGLGGFLAFFLLALALYFLMRNMNAHLRRLSYREEQEGTSGGRSGDDGAPDDPPDSGGGRGGPQDGPDLG